MPARKAAAAGLPNGRERQVIMLACEGLTDREMAARLCISQGTVGTYWRRILQNFGAKTRSQAVGAAMLRDREEALAKCKQLEAEIRKLKLLVRAKQDLIWELEKSGNPTCNQSAPIGPKPTTKIKDARVRGTLTH